MCSGVGLGVGLGVPVAAGAVAAGIILSHGHGSGKGHATASGHKKQPKKETPKTTTVKPGVENDETPSHALQVD